MIVLGGSEVAHHCHTHTHTHTQQGGGCALPAHEPALWITSPVLPYFLLRKRSPDLSGASSSDFKFILSRSSAMKKIAVNPAEAKAPIQQPACSKTLRIGRPDILVKQKKTLEQSKMIGATVE